MNIIITLFLLLAPTYLWAQKTVKATAENIPLFSSPGDDALKPIGEIKSFEEAEILITNYINRDKWYKVRVSKHNGWEKNYVEGWVQAQFFTAIESTSEADVCTECKKTVSPLGELQELSTAMKTIANKEKLIWPVSGVIRSGFGMRRHPIKKIVKLHNGIDISGNNEVNVVAAKSGTVVRSSSGCITGDKSCNDGAGNFVSIDHGDGTMTKYLHLNPKCNLAPLGDIKQGDILGCVGATGGATGPHLHFIVVIDGKPVNPILHLPKRGAR